MNCRSYIHLMHLILVYYDAVQIFYTLPLLLACCAASEIVQAVCSTVLFYASILRYLGIFESGNWRCTTLRIIQGVTLFTWLLLGSSDRTHFALNTYRCCKVSSIHIHPVLNNCLLLWSSVCIHPSLITDSCYEVQFIYTSPLLIVSWLRPSVHMHLDLSTCNLIWLSGRI